MKGSLFFVLLGVFMVLKNIDAEECQPMPLLFVRSMVRCFVERRGEGAIQAARTALKPGVIGERFMGVLVKPPEIAGKEKGIIQHEEQPSVPESHHPPAGSIADPSKKLNESASDVDAIIDGSGENHSPKPVSVSE